MHHAKTTSDKLKLFLLILWPILVTQISLNLMNLLDTMMSGRASTSDLAGVAIGSSLWLPIFTGLGGLWMAVTPIIAHLLGQNRTERVPYVVTQSVYLAIVVGVLVIAIGSIMLDPVLAIMNLDQSVHHIAKHYLIALSFGIVPLFVSNVLRYYFDAHGHTRVTMFIMLTAVPLNVGLNYILIFGKLGFPRLGGIGAGYATAVTYWIVLILSIWMTGRVQSLQSYRLFMRWYRPAWQSWKETLAIGVPMGLSIFFEASIFAVVTLLIGTQFDTVTVAAHQAAISFTTLLFMFALSISMALTILVAYEAGAQRLTGARQYTRIGVSAAMCTLGIFSIALYFLRGPIISLYTDEPAVLQMGMQFLIFAIFYQLSDAAQASLQGVLRGYKDVTVPFIIALTSYWGVGLPVGYTLAKYTALGAYGYWVGITIGLTCAGCGFFFRLQKLQKKQDHFQQPSPA